jgi:hypothetical protein
MPAPDTLRKIVDNGSDLTLLTGVAHDLLIDLAARARKSGAKLTVSTALAPQTIDTLLRFGKNVAFINGLDEYK